MERASTTPGSGEDGLDELRRRRDAGEVLPAASAPLKLAGLRLVGGDFVGLDLSGIDLAGAQLIDCDLERSRLVGANLDNAVLHGANLTDAEFLGATMRGVDLTNATLDRAGLGQVEATDSIFFGAQGNGVTFTGAQLRGADFRAANLESSRMLTTDLTEAVLAGTNLTGVDLTGAVLMGATLRGADLRHSQLRNIHGSHSADWIGTDIRDVDFTGAWNLRRHIQDENFIDEFRSQSKVHEVLFRAWSLTSDCGRSLLRWSLVTAVVAVLYAGAYTFVEIDYGDHETWLSPLYFSIVTLTTLGYGDVLPASVGAQLLVLVQVLIGYVMLGGLLSIFATKMGRRAE